MRKDYCDLCGNEMERGPKTDDTITLHIGAASLRSSLKGLSSRDDIDLHGTCFLALGLLPFAYMVRTA